MATATALFVVVSAVMAPAALEGQGQPAGGGPAARVTLSPVDVVFPTPSQFDFDAGWVEHGGVSIAIEPRNKNRPNWQLFLQAMAADMGGYGKPVQDIEVRVEGSSSWSPLSTTPLLVAEGSGSSTITIYYRLALDWMVDGPGTYTVPLEYSSSTF